MKCSSTVSELVIENGRVTAVIAEGQKYPCDAVILAAGGSSYPATGSSGDGCALAKAAGHAIVSLRPALVPLETAGSFARKMDGLGLRNINATLMIDGRKQREAFGEMTFMKTGITGPVILTISGDAVDAVRSGHDVSISVDLKPALNDAKLEARIERDCGKRAGENFGSFLRGFMAKPMVSVCAEGVGIPMKRSVSSLNAEDKKRLKMWLKGFEMKITGYRPFEEAIVTAGGVSVEEVDSASMESKIVKGLFIAGEVLDINADTGGYNLQGAFSTGWLAGRCAAESE